MAIMKPKQKKSGGMMKSMMNFAKTMSTVMAKKGKAPDELAGALAGAKPSMGGAVSAAMNEDTGVLAKKRLLRRPR